MGPRINNSRKKTNRKSRRRTMYKKYVPKVEHKLESVGARVVSTTKQTIPYLQRITRSIVEGIGKTVGVKSKSNKRTRKHK